MAREPPSQEVRSPSRPSSAARKRAAADADAPEFDHAFKYDARQDPEERRALRADYRSLIATATEYKRDPNLKPSDINDLIDRANELHKPCQSAEREHPRFKALSSDGGECCEDGQEGQAESDVFDTHHSSRILPSSQAVRQLPFELARSQCGGRRR